MCLFSCNKHSRNLTAYSIRYGYSDIGSGVVDENTINVLQIWNHENYNATNRYIHDISLIRVCVNKNQVYSSQN